MSQSNLFDKPAGAMARKSDPIESHEAATAYEASGKLRKSQQATLLALSRATGRSIRELAEGDAALIHEYGRRMSELVEMGLVKPQSWPGGRKYWLTDTGRATALLLEKDD